MNKEEIKNTVESILREVAPYDGLSYEVHRSLAMKKHELIAEKVANRLEAIVRQGVPQPVLLAEDSDHIWSLIKDWAKEVPSESHSFDPMWFGTTTRDGDIEVHKRLCDILGKPYNIKTDSEPSV